MREGNNIAIHCRDDGAGLDLAAIRRTAEEHGLLAPDKPLEPDELARLILLPGFLHPWLGHSNLGARHRHGHGLQPAAGHERLAAYPDRSRQGLPDGIAATGHPDSTHALLLRVRDQIYALSDRGIEQILLRGRQIQTLGKVTTTDWAATFTN